MAKKIMYIGAKPRKSDNVNNVPHRIWQGLGDVIEVSDLDASKLLDPGYAQIWTDVSKLSDDEIDKLVKSYEKQYEDQKRKDAARNKISARLDLAETDELQKELERRLGRRVVAKLAETSDADKAKATNSAPRSRNAPQDPKERPKTNEAVLVDIATAISAMDRENPAHFDSEGKPHLEVVTGLVGYRITQSELNHAVKTIKPE